jgi:hypothetical protein
VDTRFSLVSENGRDILLSVLSLRLFP